MTVRAWIAAASLLACSNAALAQEVSGRIDLDVLAPLSQFSPTSLVVARVVFTETEVVCPLDHGILQISAGVLRLHKATIYGNKSAAGFNNGPPIDDETHQFASTTKDCWVEIGLRQQVRGDDGAWTSLLVPPMRRPSLSPEERREAVRTHRDELRDRPSSPENFGRHVDARNARRDAGNLAHNVGSMRAPFVFEDAPKECFEALGDYLIDQQGVTFMFLTDLPGEMNRFLLERVDIDDRHSQLRLTRGDCRFELAVGASVLRSDQWRARTVAPFRPIQLEIIRDPEIGRTRIEVK